MNGQPRNQQRRLLVLLSILLATGFLTTSLVSYFVSVSALREYIVLNSLPLTSDTIYSEIQRDLLPPVFISSVMAQNTFLRDWIIGGETGEEKVSKYLREIKNRYKTFSSFLVSEKTKKYYYGDGVLKTVSEDEPRDAWYFRVREMESLYETNVDPDMANRDALTVFVNYKVHDYDGNYLGATGVGLTIDSVVTLMERYDQKYQRGVYFTDKVGKIVLRSSSVAAEVDNVRDIEGLAEVADEILSRRGSSLRIKRNGGRVYLNSRFIPELSWHLVVEQPERSLVRRIFEALMVNILLCTIITGLVLTLTYLSVNAYQKRIDQMFAVERNLRQVSLEQQQEITRKNEALTEKNTELEAALAEVKRLSGLLPICANCKKVRDDQGYWRQVETYLSERADVTFSHGICPECSKKLYPELSGE